VPEKTAPSPADASQKKTAQPAGEAAPNQPLAPTHTKTA